MPAIKINEDISVVDSGLGPMYVTETRYSGFDVDDLCHSQAMAQAISLQLINKAANIDPTLAEGRPPVDIGGISFGGNK